MYALHLKDLAYVMKISHCLNFLHVTRFAVRDYHLHCYQITRVGIHRQVNSPKAALPENCLRSYRQLIHIRLENPL